MIRSVKTTTEITYYCEDIEAVKRALDQLWPEFEDRRRIEIDRGVPVDVFTGGEEEDTVNGFAVYLSADETVEDTTT